MPSCFGCTSGALHLRLDRAAGVGAGIGVGALLRFGRVPTQALSHVVPAACALLLALGLAAYPAAFTGDFVEDPTPSITVSGRCRRVSWLSACPPKPTRCGLHRAARAGEPRVRAAVSRRVLPRGRPHAPARSDSRLCRTHGAAAGVHAAVSRDGLPGGGRIQPATVGDAWAGSFEPFGSMVRERVEKGRRFALLDAVRAAACSPSATSRSYRRLPRRHALTPPRSPARPPHGSRCRCSPNSRGVCGLTAWERCRR